MYCLRADLFSSCHLVLNSVNVLRAVVVFNTEVLKIKFVLRVTNELWETMFSLVSLKVYIS